MEVLNISLDENEADTSHDELDEDPDFKDFALSPRFKKFINHELVSASTNGNFSGLFKEWERPQMEEGSLLYSSSPWEAQPEPFQFLFLDSVSSVSGIRNKVILTDRDVNSAPLHTVMRLFGVARAPLCSESEEGDDENRFSNEHTFSVCCNVHGFLPYFYALPTLEYGLGSEEFSSTRRELEARLNEDVASAIMQDLSLVEVHDFLCGNAPVVVRIEEVKLNDVENSIYHLPPNKTRSKEMAVLKIYVALPMFIRITAGILKEMKLVVENGGRERNCEFEPYENSLTNNIRFLTDQNIPGCTWLELKAGRYFNRTISSDGKGLERESHCQIELDVHYCDIMKVAEQDQPKGILPLRVLSFDLESRVDLSVSSPSDSGGQSQVIQIGAVLSTYGASGSPIIGKAVFVLGTCDPLPDAKVIQFYDKDNPGNNTEENLLICEAFMLASFRDFVIQMDPDIITGYNIKNFDLPYLIERAEKFSHQFEEMRRFPFLGRLKKIRSSLRPIINEDKKIHRYDKRIVNIQGRVIMDMFPLYVRHSDAGRKSLKLKDVSKRHLKAGDEKDNVKYTEINALQDGNSTTRKRLAKYCVQDSYLPIKLMLVHMPDRASLKINFLEYYFENSQLSGTILRYLVNKSKEYNKYFKQVRVQKNDGRVKYHPDSPVKKLYGQNQTLVQDTVGAGKAVVVKRKRCGRMLFTDDD